MRQPKDPEELLAIADHHVARAGEPPRPSRPRSPDGPARDRDLTELRARLGQPTPAPDPGRYPHDSPHLADGPERPDGPDYSR